MGWVQTGPIGQIKDIWINPCANPVQIYVETFTEALIKLWWSYNEPDTKHITHWTTGHSWLCNMKTYFSDVKEATGSYNTPGLKEAFLITEVVDIATWYFFIGSIAEQFLINWHSGIMRGGLCQLHPGSNYGYGNHPAIGGISNGVYNGEALWDADDGSRGGGECQIRPGGSGQVGGSTQFFSFGTGLPCPGGLRCRDQGTGEILNVDDYLNGGGMNGIYKSQIKITNAKSVNRVIGLEPMAFSPDPVQRYVAVGGFGFTVNAL